ncbi:MAG TPA: TOMM precursor leader peptide-binding protein [Solirubrobacterales bacterium]|nr:TOMM precursor leader peptide-binding protein [Solirubrobacterales bacterium]
MQRPRIKRTTESIETPDGDLYLLRASTDSDIRIEKPDAEQRRLLQWLDGRHSRQELEAEFGPGPVGEALSQLGELELVEDASDDERLGEAERARFDRQLRYFSDVGSGLTPSECQERLREARVLVLGVGGLGVWAALSLACCGIGEMLVIDGDRIEPSNLNRQVLYAERDIGRLKAEVAAERLRAFNSAMRVEALARRLEGEEEIAAAISGWDVVLDAADWPAHDIERWVNAACFEAGIPYITMSHFPPIARVGPLYVPGRTGCFACQETAYRRAYPLFDIAIEQRRAKPSPAANLGPACGLIGGQVGLELMHHITGLSTPSTLGAAHIYDLRTMAVQREAVTPEPDCPVCGHLPKEAGGRAPEEALAG